MGSWVARFVFAVGACTLAFGLYVGSFYLVRNSVIDPYERIHSPKTHPLRPTYNFVYYPLRRFAANGSSFKPEKVEVYFGTLEKRRDRGAEPHMRNAGIGTLNNSFVSIGFTGKQAIMEQFDQIEIGSYVRMKFGVALSKDHDRFINRLIDFEIIDLMDDPRIEYQDFTPEETDRIREAFGNLAGPKLACATEYLKRYKDKVLTHCLQAGYAENIGGGCYHIVGRSVTTSVMQHTMNICSE